MKNISALKYRLPVRLFTLTLGVYCLLQGAAFAQDGSPATATTTTATTAAPPAQPERPASNTEITEIKRQVLDDLLKLKDRLQTCSKIAVGFDRLACYDRVSEDMGFLADEEVQRREQSLGKFGLWDVSSKTDEKGKESISLKLPSANAIRGAGTSRTLHPVITIRCKAKESDLYLDWTALLANKSDGQKSTTISYTLDGGEEVEQDWDYSVDYFGAFAADPVSLIREMKSKKILTIKIAPSDDEIRTVTFNLQGFDSALQTLVNRCYK